MSAAIWVLALPVLVQQTMAACVGMFDKIVAGSLPEGIVVPAMDGLGIGSYIGWFIGISMAGLGIGAQAIIARAMGAGNRPEAERAVGQAVGLSVVWGAAVGVILWLGAPLLAQVCQLEGEAARYCVLYVRVLALSMPPCGIMMVGSMCLHGGGDTTRPSLIAVGVNVVNVILSWMLSGADLRLGERVFENPFGFDLHVTGIALGTAGGYLIGGLLTLLVLLRGIRDLRLRWPETRPDRSMMGRIVRIGVPNFMEGISMWAVNLLVLVIIGVIAQRTVGGGAGLQGAHIIAVQWEAFSFMPGFAIGVAAGTLAGQYLGAGNPAMARRAILVCTGAAIVIMGLLGLVFIFAGRWLTSIVSTEPVHLEQVPPLLVYAGLAQVAFAITMVVRQGLRGVGDTRWTFLITTASSYFVRLPAAYFFGVTLDMGLAGVWIGLCGELPVRAVLFSARFLHGGWRRLRV